MANGLAHESSPYLRQHAGNPVDWLPWGPVALRRAAALDRPLLLSIGYAACHWCHVMERESFSDPEIAELMNESFVCVKVDREERPDLDAVYLEAVQTMTGQGGWPLNVFLTPEQMPFYGGTYFPPGGERGRTVPGMPTWREVLAAVAEAWESRREEIRAGVAQLGERLAAAALAEPARERPGRELLEGAVRSMAGAYDERRGGFGGAPKFPPSSTVELLLAVGERPMALGTLRAMAAGGIHDQVGGGFHRYSVDATWTVPHFEKMLYDNALLARAYLHAGQLTGEAGLLEVCRGTLDWALREMRGPEGAFHSSLDADSEGREGAFYVWTVEELRAALGEDADEAMAWFGVTAEGNFQDPHAPLPGLNVLRGDGPAPAAPQRALIRAKLLQARSRRPRPATDEKRLTSWNALMIAALADAGAALDESSYLQAARDCAAFILGEMRDDRGRLLRSHARVRSSVEAYLDDHAYLVEGLLRLYEGTFEERWFTAARELADTMIERFADPERGGFFQTSADHEELIARRKDLEDSPLPSGSSSAALGLLRLAALTGESRYERAADSAIALAQGPAGRYPLGFGHMLQAIDFRLGPVREVALAGARDRGGEELVAVVRSLPRPRLVLAGGPGGSGGAGGPGGSGGSDGPGGSGGSDGTESAVPLMRGRAAVEGRAAAYVCEGFVCERPVTTPAELAELID